MEKETASSEVIQDDDQYAIKLGNLGCFSSEVLCVFKKFCFAAHVKRKVEELDWLITHDSKVKEILLSLRPNEEFMTFQHRSMMPLISAILLVNGTWMGTPLTLHP